MHPFAQLDWDKIHACYWTLFLMSLALCANCRVDSVSPKHLEPGWTLAMMYVLAFPPRESWSHEHLSDITHSSINNQRMFLKHSYSEQEGQFGVSIANMTGLSIGHIHQGHDHLTQTHQWPVYAACLLNIQESTVKGYYNNKHVFKPAILKEASTLKHQKKVCTAQIFILFIIIVQL